MREHHSMPLSACEEQIRGLQAYLQQRSFHELDGFLDLLEKTRGSCQPLLQQKRLEENDFDCIRIRHQGIKRLCVLNAPHQIIEHEFKWLKRMTDFLLDLIEAPSPQMTQKEIDSEDRHMTADSNDPTTE